MKSIQSVIRKSLIQGAVLVIIAIFLLTNLGFTWMFSRYIGDIRANEVQLVLEAIRDAYADNTLEQTETTILRQTANQSSVLLRLYDREENLIFDSTIGGNGNKRPFLSREKEVIEPSEIVYTQFTIQKPDGSIMRSDIGQQKGWLINGEDIAFLIGVNVVYLIILVVAIPVVLHFSKWLSERLSRPILQIHQATEKLHHGDYQLVKVDRSQTIELDDLAEAIESLAYQMGQQENLRKRLTTDIAHELRSPLAVIRSQLEGLSDGVLEATPERYGRLDSEIIRLTKLIDDLSELTVVENELYTLNRKMTDITALTTELCEGFRPLFEAKSLDLHLMLEPQLIWPVDEERYRQILVNLLTNALKYTEQGAIQVRLGKQKKDLVLEVADTGIGIEEKNLPFIFQRFYRVDPSRSRETGGAGIGLAIVKQLVTAHGGHVDAQSSLGQGTKIQITFTSLS